jgi:hypothetical protein
VQWEPGYSMQTYMHAYIHTYIHTDRQTDRETDMTKLIVPFRNFANAAKNQIPKMTYMH